MDYSDQKINDRKDDHININLQKDVQSKITTGLEKYQFVHNPLPNMDLNHINMECEFLNKELKAPLMISSMTGGTSEGLRINTNLAIAAQAKGIALALGSGRAGLDSPDTAKTYYLRKWAPDIPIYANLGAIQLNYGCGLEECKRVVEMAQADALIFHLNSLQEALQPEGQTNFHGLNNKIESICRQLGVPVIVKEVGWGINAKTARMLMELGVTCIDVAGAGGTSWSEVEKHRNDSDDLIRISSYFNDWGLQTAEAVKEVHLALPGVPLIASGGLRNGMDIAKCIALGADIGGIAGGFLKAATQSAETVVAMIDEIILGLRITMFAVGANNIEYLKKTSIHRRVNNG
jgi:isopentenyl-diphosphate Delta-isomerase